MTPLAVSLAGLVTVMTAMSLLWWISLGLRDSSIVDPFWPWGFVLIGSAYAVAWGSPGAKAILLLGLLTAWALRLGLHLLRRNRAHGEDPSYAAMRRHHGPAFGRVSLFTVFWLQGVILWVVSAPVLGVVVGEEAWGWWDVAGFLAALTGVAMEAVADGQLRRFRRDPDNRGRVLDTGLWRYSRHPNYFADAVLWWGIYIIAVGSGAAWTVFGPLLMTVLLLRVSGVTLLERGLRRTRPGYEDYVRSTSAFVPWFPRRKRQSRS
jgi:steroid 5-alpha reductase family enzyme